MSKPAIPILVAFSTIENRETAEAYLTAEARKVTSRLHSIFDEYNEMDWPLLVTILEMYAAKVYETSGAEARQVIDRLRGKA